MYRRIADDLRRRIVSGELSAGQQLPTQMELVERYGVARMTVRQAIRELVNEGLVVSRRPQGLFVRDGQPMIYRPQAEFRPRPASPEMDQYMTELHAEGRTPAQTIDVALVQAPPVVARRLQVSEDTTVVVRRRVRFIDGLPHNINDSYFPRNLVDGSEIMSPVDITRGANKVLAELGAEQVRALDEITVRMPAPDEVQRLALDPGTPVAVHVCTGYTADDRPVRCVINILAGDKHVIMYERIRPTDPA
jgi:DNA-binding GntR family transcriptional regulator